MIVTQTPSVATLKGRKAVVVTNDILVETAQVPCYMHGICQEYCFFQNTDFSPKKADKSQSIR